jgi:hypothetical protein
MEDEKQESCYLSLEGADGYKPGTPGRGQTITWLGPARLC